MSLSRFWLLSCCLLMASCGTEQYEARLKETNAFFEYRQSLDKVLQSGAWVGPNTITMRIPHGFRPLSPPPAPKEGEPPQADLRQPSYMGLELPGLVAAWQGDFPCDAGNLPAFLYVCSNHHMFNASPTEGEKPPEPELFLTEFENLLSTAMQVQLPPGESPQVGDNVRYREVCPREPKYALSKHFTGITFVPPGVLTQVGMQIPIKGQYYGHYNGKIHVAVLAIYPASIRERMEDKLRTALETFSVSGAVPQAALPKTPGVPGANQTAPPAGF